MCSKWDCGDARGQRQRGQRRGGGEAALLALRAAPPRVGGFNAAAADGVQGCGAGGGADRVAAVMRRGGCGERGRYAADGAEVMW